MTTIEKSLVSPETRLALVKVIAENSFDSVLITDATSSGKIIYANKAFKTLLAMTHLTSLVKTLVFFRVLQLTKNSFVVFPKL